MVPAPPCWVNGTMVRSNTTISPSAFITPLSSKRLRRFSPAVPTMEGTFFKRPVDPLSTTNPSSVCYASPARWFLRAGHTNTVSTHHSLLALPKNRTTDSQAWKAVCCQCRKSPDNQQPSELAYGLDPLLPFSSVCDQLGRTACKQCHSRNSAWVWVKLLVRDIRTTRAFCQKSLSLDALSPQHEDPRRQHTPSPQFHPGFANQNRPLPTLVQGQRKRRKQTTWHFMAS